MGASSAEWTHEVKTALCVAGQKLGYWVCAAGVDDHASDSGEWLYDVTWLDYVGETLISAPLVVECEWSASLHDINYDFQKLLLARAAVRLMIFDGGDAAGADRVAGQMAEQVAGFSGSRDVGEWLFAAWIWDDDDERGWSFRWFTIESGVLHQLPD